MQRKGYKRLKASNKIFMSDEERLVRDGDDIGLSSGDKGGIIFEDRTTTTTDGGVTIAGTTLDASGYDPEGMVRAVKKELSGSIGKSRLLVVPDFSNLANVLKFLRVLKQDEWLRANTIIVAFFPSSTNEWAFGITGLNNRAFWYSKEGKRSLNASQIRIYSIEDYVEIIELTSDSRVSDAVTRIVS